MIHGGKLSIARFTFDEDGGVVRPPRSRLELGRVQEGERARRHVGLRRRRLPQRGGITAKMHGSLRWMRDSRNL